MSLKMFRGTINRGHLLKLPLRVTCLALVGVIILGEAGCAKTPPEPLPWEEDHGRFYTLDLARAQEEIPFPIVLPDYVPDRRKDAPPPTITGPLRGYQYDDKVKIRVMYGVDLGGKVFGMIEISESDYPILPPDPDLNPGYETVDIRGKRVLKREGDWAPGTKVVFYFNHEGIYYIVDVYDFPAEEAVKIVESMIE